MSCIIKFIPFIVVISRFYFTFFTKKQQDKHKGSYKEFPVQIGNKDEFLYD